MTPTVCWKCGFGHRSYDSYCRQCGSDWDCPSREPTEAELAGAPMGGPTYIKRLSGDQWAERLREAKRK